MDKIKGAILKRGWVGTYHWRRLGVYAIRLPSATPKQASLVQGIRWPEAIASGKAVCVQPAQEVGEDSGKWIETGAGKTRGQTSPGRGCSQDSNSSPQSSQP